MSGEAPEAAPRIVLDTNVCLDLLLFRDPHCALLAAALAGGRLVALGNDRTGAEWRRVLAYPALGLDAAAQARLVAAWDARTTRLAWTPAPALPALPRCKDPDDQVFLELAAAGGARWLLSRDRHLLALAGRCRRSRGFDIATPEAWAAAGGCGTGWVTACASRG